MSVDIALDQDGHDLLIRDGELKLAEGLDHVSQNLKIRLQFYLGEWFLDITEGVPFYSDILVKNPNISSIDSILKARILSTLEVTNLLEYKSEFNNVTREYTVNAKVKTIYGVLDLETSLFNSGI